MNDNHSLLQAGVVAVDLGLAFGGALPARAGFETAPASSRRA